MARGEAAENARPAIGHGGSGLPAIAASILMSGLLCWLWIFPGIAKAIAPSPELASGVSQLAQVAPKDVEAALATMNGSEDFLAQFKADKYKCPVPLAWISLTQASDHSSETLRVQSGQYVSPAFKPGTIPLRVAIPYPAAYETGRGVLGVVGVDGSAIVALQPEWRVSGTGKEVRHPVTWLPTPRCTNGS